MIVDLYPFEETVAKGGTEDEIVEKQTATITRVLEEFGRIAFLDIGEAFDEQGNLLPIRQMPEGVRRAISGIEYEDIFSGRGEDREWRRPLLELAGHHDVVAVEVRDPREQELTNVGLLYLVDPETGDRIGET